MSFSRPNAVPRVPTPPAGDEVAAYDTYLEAQQAVDYLSDHKFAVEHVTIVGTDLRMVERVTGRLTYGRVALAGALSGAWFGFFVGLLLSLFGGTTAGGVLLVAIGLGAGFGLLFSVLSYALTGGRRDFTSSSQIVASTYAILCATEHAGDARSMLLESPGGLGKARRGSTAPAPVVPAPGAPVATAPAAPAAPRTPDPRWTTPSGAPRYGAMRPTEEQPPAPQAPPAPAQPAEPTEPQAPEQPEGTEPKATDDPYRPPQP
ncbi:general stress protein [Isoptericola sp. NPDC057559]|uniref:general stress protein n=1 Tax=Isoptericola sp. NPDC057559 TaxID=3346168 RepID=UPI0036947821